MGSSVPLRTNFNATELRRFCRKCVSKVTHQVRGKASRRDATNSKLVYWLCFRGGLLFVEPFTLSEAERSRCSSQRLSSPQDA